MLSVRTLLIFLTAGAAFAADVKVIEQIVAKVNEDIITTGELARARLELRAQLQKQGLKGDQLEAAVKAEEGDLLRDKIDQRLLVERGKQLDLKVDGEVTKRLAEIQSQAKIADQDKFQQFIRETAGMPFEDFKQEIKNNALRRRVIGAEVMSRINIPTPEAQKYYDEHKDQFIREERVFLREIFVSTDGKPEKEIPALEKKAKDLVARARAGEKFAELAKDNSDAESAAEGGRTPPIKRSDLRKELADIAFTKEKGYVTDPIKTDKGFLIFQVDDRHTAGLAPFEEVEDEIKNALTDPRFDAAMRSFLTKLRTEAFLQIHEGYVDTGAAPGKDTTWRGPAELRPETVTKEEVASKIYRKRLFWMVPIPHTSIPKESSSNPDY
jgi:peptidyl-prolyl cis-trans isomerase SurA